MLQDDQGSALLLFKPQQWPRVSFRFVNGLDIRKVVERRRAEKGSRRREEWGNVGDDGEVLAAVGQIPMRYLGLIP